jgi:predicted nucleic acid-binding protein
MKLIVDANVLFSALIKDSITAEILLSDKLQLYTPEFIIREFEKHKNTIIAKTHRSKESFEEIQDILKEVINIIPKEEYMLFYNEALLISPDKNDAMYFALAIKYGCAIWSNDAKIKQQDSVLVHNTKEILELIK